MGFHPVPVLVGLHPASENAKQWPPIVLWTRVMQSDGNRHGVKLHATTRKDLK